MSELLAQQKLELSSRIEKAWVLAEKDSAASAMNYLRHVVINSQPPALFRDIAEPWQWAIASRLIPAVEFVANVRRKYSGPQRFWLTLPKGHDKTTFIARMLNWAMRFARTHLTAYAAAKDRDQAALIADAMMTEASLNPWIKRGLEFKNWRVHGACDSRLHILATDAGGNQGIRGDFVTIDELSQWTDEEFFRTIVSGISKRPRGVLVIITNAGVEDSWQHDALRLAKRLMAETGLWYVYEAPHRLASWMNEDAIAQDRLLMPEVMGRMLYDNVWAPARLGCEYVTREQASKCEVPQHALVEDPLISYFLAIDYGPVKDRTALCRLHRDGDGIFVDELQVWQGSKDSHVPISRVEEWIDEQRSKYRIDTLVIDQYQMESTIQKYSGLVNIEVFKPRGSDGNHAMAENLRHLIVNGQAHWRQDCGTLTVEGKDGRLRSETFTDELASVAVKVLPSGYRITNPPGSHDDRVCAVGMATLYAVRRPRKKDLWGGDSGLWF